MQQAMRKSRLELEQGSPQWHALRKNQIGASDVPIIMRVSPYKTAYALWAEKTGRIAPAKSSSAMTFGTQMEAYLRESYEASAKISMNPEVVISERYPWLMASLDGLSPDGRVILEIKTCNLELFERCLADKDYIVDHHWWQVQAQLACTPSAERVDYMLFHKGREPIIRQVMRDDAKFLECIEKCYEFWLQVKEDRHPEIGAEDYVFVEKNPDFELAAKEWLSAKASLKGAEEREKIARARLLEEGDGGNMLGYGVKVDRIVKEGSIQYDQIPELRSIDLAAYRKAPSVYFKITQVDSE